MKKEIQLFLVHELPPLMRLTGLAVIITILQAVAFSGWYVYKLQTNEAFACQQAWLAADTEYIFSNSIKKQMGLPLAPGKTVPQVCQPFLAANKGTSFTTSSGVHITVSPNTLLLD